MSVSPRRARNGHARVSWPLLLALSLLLAGRPAPAAANTWGLFSSPWGAPYYQRDPAPYYRDAAPYRGMREFDAPRRLRPSRSKPPRDKAAKHTQPSRPVKGPLLVVVSIDDQRLALYANGELIERSAVSTGVPGHPTPMGIFSIIQKNRYHRSNIYSGAPMPFMQRITWSGVALHAGIVPGRPASHGCIRLPNEFAAKLWGMTRLGARVVVTRRQPHLAEFSHPSLFAWRPRAIEPPSMDEPPPELIPAALRGVTAAVPRTTDGGGVLAAGLGLRRNRLAGTETVATDGEAPTASAPMMGSLDLSRPVASDPPLRPGPISVFISRKDRKLYVRKGFAPVFESPIAIDDPEKPIGTHLFTSMEFRPNDSRLRWTVVSIPSDSRNPASEFGVKEVMRPHLESGARRGHKALPAAVSDPGAALERLRIPQAVIDRISEMISPGASLVISDSGIGHETGKETDFVVLTR